MADWEAVTILGRTCMLLAAAGVLAGCGSSSAPVARTSIPPPPAAIASVPAPATSVPPSPPQSDGFNGPGQFSVAWNAVAVTASPCPPAHPTATCYTATGTASLPLLGPVTLTRKVIVGDGSETPPPGCVNAETTGTLENVTGMLTFTAVGELCGKRTAFTVSSSTTSGAMSPHVLHAVIINDASVSDTITETWSGEIAQN